MTARGTAGRRPRGVWLPPEGRSHGGAPPILFLEAPKRECAAPGGREKAHRRVGLRRRRPPAAGGGWLALPCRSQGRKRPTLGETFGPGKFGIHAAPIFAAAGSSARGRERQRKEQQLNATTTPTPSAPSATGRQYRPRRRPKRARRQGQIGAGTDTPTPVQQLCTYVQSCDQKRSFLLDRARPVFFSTRWTRKWGVHPAWTMPLAGAGIPLAAVRRPHHTHCRVYPANSPSHGTPPINQR